MEKTTHYIENEHLKIGVLETGAELCSILNKKSGREHIWQANPDVWGSHAPNLFPIIGMLKDGEYQFEGATYSLPKHGIIRHNDQIRLKERTEDQLVFELLYSEETLKMYPFKFAFRIYFILKDKQLEVKHHIVNLDEKPLYFSLGGHPAFNILFSEDEKIEDYSLQFDQKLNLKTEILDENGLLGEKTEVILKDEQNLQLRPDLFDKDALIFRSIRSKKVELQSKTEGAILGVEFEDFKDLGIWAKPNAAYVCIEPWLGYTDLADSNKNFKEKAGNQMLNANNDFQASYQIRIY